MLEVIYLILMILFLFGITIFVHEWGHFIVARKCGLKVEAFAIGMGPSIWQKEIDDVTYKICIFPIGGYVSLPQLDPEGMNKIQGENGDNESTRLPEIDPWKKIAVALAGPLCNIIFALLIGIIVWLGDHPDNPAIIGKVDAGSKAFDAGIRAGDKIISINNNTVNSWYDAQVEALLSGSNSVPQITILRDQDKVIIKNIEINNPEKGIPLIDGISEAIPCIVGSVNKGSPVEIAGIQKDDIIKSFNKIIIHDWNHFTEIVQKYPNQSVPLTIQRNEDILIKLEIVPQFDKSLERAIIGIRLGGSTAMPWTLHGDPIKQIKNDSSAIFRLLKALITPTEAEHAAKGLGGPVAIFTMIWMALKMGIINALALIRFININLAILNLLPIPVLDGGHIMFSLYEGITKRKIPPKLISRLVNIFAVLLISAMIWLSIRDVERVVKLDSSKENKPKTEFNQKP